MILDREHMVGRDPFYDGYTYDELKVGDKAYYAKTITDYDVGAFAGCTTDISPVHLNEEFARNEAGLPGRIVHGAFTNSLVSAATGLKMPGQGSLYLMQNSKFRRMVQIGDTLTVVLEVIEKIEKHKFVRLSTMVYNQRDELVLEGEALTRPRIPKPVEEKVEPAKEEKEEKKEKKAKKK